MIGKKRNVNNATLLFTKVYFISGAKGYPNTFYRHSLNLKKFNCRMIQVLKENVFSSAKRKLYLHTP